MWSLDIHDIISWVELILKEMMSVFLILLWTIKIEVVGLLLEFVLLINNNYVLLELVCSSLWSLLMHLVINKTLLRK